EMYPGAQRARFDALCGAVRWTQYSGDCYAYGLLSLGFVDLVTEQLLSPYDFVPLVPVVRGAGGYIADWSGDELGLHSDGRVVAANRRELAEEAVGVLLHGPGAA